MATSLPVTSSSLSLPTREQVELYNRNEWPPPFLRQTLFPLDKVFSGPAVQLVYKKHARRLAPLVAAYQYGRILLDSPATAQMVSLPLFGPTRVIRADDALPLPMCGYIPPSGNEIVARLQADAWFELESSISAREEQMCAQVLTTGVVDVRGDEDPAKEPGGHIRIQYEINAPSDETWDAGMDLIAWLQAQCRTLAAKSGSRPDTLILGSAAASLFMSNASVQKERELLANLRDTSPEVEDAATMFLGRFAALNCWEYCGLYVATELDGDKFVDVIHDMIPSGCAILASSHMPGALVYGGVSVTENDRITVFSNRRVPFSWVDKDNALWKIRVSSRVAPCPADTASWQTYTNVVGSTPTEPPSETGGETRKANAKK